MMANIFNANNSVIIIEKTSFHSCFHKAASIDVEKLAYARLLYFLAIIQSVFCYGKDSGLHVTLFLRH